MKLVDHIYAVVFIQPDGSEGVGGIKTDQGILPSIASDYAVLLKIVDVAKKSGDKFKIYSFTKREELKIPE